MNPDDFSEWVEGVNSTLCELAERVRMIEDDVLFILDALVVFGGAIDLEVERQE